jgi:ornithine cyclodeaminase/alanine dehydrogenase-like protein (mu-crystallin family)
MLLISAENLRKLVSMREAIDVVRQAFIDVSRGVIEQPTRVAVGGGSALAMIARHANGGGTVLKAITIRRDNSDRGLPNIQALVVWFDGLTGAPLAALDGTSLTAMRTGAASGVATALLAPADASVLTIIGAGGQAPDQVRAVCAVRPIREVRVAARSYGSAQRLALTLEPEISAAKIVACETVVEAVSGADVVCTATNSERPLFAADDLTDRVHLNAIGAYTLTMCELPADLLGSADVVAVDQVEAALAEAGDLVSAIRDGTMQVGDLVEIGALLRQEPPRFNGRTVFKSVGIAAQDLALARLATDKAMAIAGFPTVAL